jgi:hypothetical protein
VVHGNACMHPNSSDQLLTRLQCGFGMSCLFVERNGEVIPRPDDFDPDRWLESEAARHHLEHNLLTFGKGTRSCVGQNLAYAEMFITLSTVVRRLGHRLRLHDTTADDMTPEFEYFAGMLKYENGRVLKVKLAPKEEQ